MRRFIYNVLTPLYRVENLRKLIPMLEAQNVVWHVVYDEDTPFRVSFNQPWIKTYVCPNPENTFFTRCNYALNWMLDNNPPELDGRFMFMNDDDLLEPGYFDKLDQHEGDVLISSMKRGDNIPVGVQFERAHGTTTLMAAPENIQIGGVGLEQITMSGRLLRGIRLPLEVAGDGRMVMWTVATYGAVYAPEAFVWFNALESGRWNSLPA